MTNVQNILDEIEKFAPLSLKEEGDPTGFQIGDRTRTVKKVLVTLDVRPNVVQEAIEKDIDLIIAHHPIMFRPTANLDINDPQNKMYYDLMSHDIAVHSAHTNIDKTVNGMNDWLAEALNLQNIQSIDELDGLGRIGEVQQETTLDDFSEEIKNKFNLSGLRTVKPYIEKPVKKIAIIGGDGGKFFRTIKGIGADTFITGDVYYHTAHDMQAIGLNVIDPGHHVEEIFINKMENILQSWNEDYNWDIQIVPSRANTEPYIFK
ncbi:GTP cyclohydrolase 1 type 2 [Companilactobacillus sp. RD055328]|uniref:Nif3-like dinuclear metal center hexameric protein n=1 Tax=Companilactobacillus sp. RD055328 TaxID=2916634 RepID=UPI001FC81915|nr:Nif3-like dinuclear metal center hexameric protein [Companilactobacillus sp. RD055328]GKQ42667.1 GTP cyclohydrolase 1 type 2 [Companilactobacillus sp. RD055328]